MFDFSAMAKPFHLGMVSFERAASGLSVGIVWVGPCRMSRSNYQNMATFDMPKDGDFHWYIGPKAPFAAVSQAEFFTIDSPHSATSFDIKESREKNWEL